MIVSPMLTELRSPAGLPFRGLKPRPDDEPPELYREPCEDAFGNSYCVVVWRTAPGLSLTFYTLVDGSTVNYVDDHTFEIDSTGELIARLD